jgi:hypothetical protein
LIRHTDQVLNKVTGRLHDEKEHFDFLPGDHLGLCKFSKEQKEQVLQFKAVGEELKKLAQRSRKAKRSCCVPSVPEPLQQHQLTQSTSSQ